MGLLSGSLGEGYVVFDSLVGLIDVMQASSCVINLFPKLKG